MKTSELIKHNVSQEVVELIIRLIALIPWPERRQAMGDVVLTILDGKPRVAKNEFGWNRSAVMTGIKEFESDISRELKRRTLNYLSRFGKSWNRKVMQTPSYAPPCSIRT